MNLSALKRGVLDPTANKKTRGMVFRLTQGPAVLSTGLVQTAKENFV
jgi:hypothetical protein